MKKKEKLSQTRIKKLLKDEYKNTGILIFDTIDSTNLEAKRRADMPCPFIILADSQTAGRGRLGRSFYSPSGTGLYMTVTADAKSTVKESVTLTCAAAAAVCMAIEELTGSAADIKWVNDIYMGGKKVCGILTEGSFDPETAVLKKMMIGIGINISTESFPEGIEAASISADISRNELAAKTANNIFDISAGRKEWLSYYREHSFITGRRIKYIKDGKTLSGTAGEINSSGALKVTDDNGGIEYLFTGEITVRAE